MDLGCGTGKVTGLLCERWPQAMIQAIDNSKEMLAAARARDSRMQWIEGDINCWEPDSTADLIFSNAVLHWVDDHEKVLNKLGKHINPHGALAVQMPRNLHAPTHTALLETVQAGPWSKTLTPFLRPNPVQMPQHYYEVLTPQFDQIDIWETEYLHVLRGKDPVSEWTKGSLLRPLLPALSAKQRTEFERDYRRRIRKAYPPDASGRTLLPFKRLFIIALKAE